MLKNVVSFVKRILAKFHVTVLDDATFYDLFCNFVILRFFVCSWIFKMKRNEFTNLFRYSTSWVEWSLGHFIRSLTRLNRSSEVPFI